MPKEPKPNEPKPREPVHEPDPFDPPDPADPYRLSEPPPKEPPTIEPPVLPPIDPDRPPPPPAAPPQTPPPGHVELTTAKTKLEAILPEADKDAAKDLALESTTLAAMESRSNLAEFWSGRRFTLLTGLTEAMRGEKDPEKLAEFGRIKGVLAGDGKLMAALDAWCANRNPIGREPDLKGLAATVDTIATEAKNLADLIPLKKGGVVAEEFDKLYKCRASLEKILMGVVKEIARENAEILNGQRVDIGNPSDAAVLQLCANTRDGDVAINLNKKLTWDKVGATLKEKFDAASSKSPISVGPDGKPISLDLGPLGGRLQELDSTSKKREELAKKLAESAKALEAARDPAERARLALEVDNNRHDYSQSVNDVVQAYLRVARELQGHADALKNRAKELDDPKASKKKGWNAETVGTLGDLTFVTVRMLREYLAGDPATRDPDYGGVARKVVKDLDGIRGTTRLESNARANAGEPGKYWSKTKVRELKNLKTGQGDSEGLKKQFGKKLEPLLDSWAGQVKKFPRHDRDVSRQLVTQIAGMLQEFRNAARGAAPDTPDRRASAAIGGLVEGIDTIATMIAVQLHSFDQRGGMFG